jgi:hypothetical protein
LEKRGGGCKLAKRIMGNDNVKEQIIKRKAEFYFTMNLKCHIKLKGTGFRNGWITSEYIEDGSYFSFRDLRFPERTDRIFLDEIFDISDYEEVLE